MQGTPRTPPRFVPTLTEVIDAPTGGGFVPVVDAPGLDAGFAFTAQMQQALVERVLQRVDQTLSLRLREALAAAALEQAEATTRRMRVEIESVVSELVAQAVAAELGARSAHGSSRG